MFATQPRDLVLAPAERITLASIFQTFAPAESDTDNALDGIERKLRLMPAGRSSQFISLLQLLGGPLLTAALTGKALPFQQLPFVDRERLLLKMANSEIAKLRSAFQALKRMCLFMAYAAVDTRGVNTLWKSIGYPGPRQDRPAHVSTLHVLAQPPEDLSADVVVVGSGAGGGVSAAVFARSGKRVVVLEAGPNIDSGSFTQREAEMLSAMYLDAATATSDDSAVSLLAGACIGGGTTINSAACIALPPDIAAQWGDASGGVNFNGSLAKHVASVGERLQLAFPSSHGRNNDVLVRGCERLGWHVGFLQRNATGCGDGCGYCAMGCAYGCKKSTPATYLQDAVAAGASIIANCKVERVLLQAGRARGVEALFQPSRGITAGRRVRVHAPLVVLAAGALRTPGILKRSGVSNEHIGRHLHLHPSTGIAAIFDEEIELWRGLMQTAYSDHFADLDQRFGAWLEAVPLHPGQLAFALPWQGRAQHAQLMREVRQLAALIALTRDQGEGYLGGPNAERIHYRLNAYDCAHMLRAVNGLVEVALAAGARRVLTVHSSPLVLESAKATFQQRAAFRTAIHAAGAQPNRLGIFSAHQMGTCRMHRDPRHGVVDESGAVHGTRGLIITDASVFPLASGVNPMLTIMALAHRSAAFHASV